MNDRRKITAFLLAVALALAAAADGLASQRRKRLKAPAAKRMTTKQSSGAIPTGTWGGEHVRLEVTEGGAEIEFDCAHGKIDQRIVLDGNGCFDVRGTYVPEGGPVSVPVEGVAQEKGSAARYRGRVAGRKMTLTVTLPETGNTLEEFSLTHGAPPRLEKCY